ncbi:MAG: hypothetical protein GWO24_13935, partial [Akkermansiaceae bacterium]|nr:hypothetical protein [Akkermansiaceae bacterium]
TLGMVSVTCLAGVVTNTDDSGPGSLREEIAEAAPGDTVTFASSLGGATIFLTSGQLVVDKDLTIDGSGLVSPVTVDAGEADASQRVALVTAGVSVVIDTLILTGGVTPRAPGSVNVEHGGGIHNAGSLTIR